ncbi:MAG: NUDIX hydrolase [Alphaproteobacteria bacterium]|nr:NUDIX hydrolase [Alphaproteobacteria bacterium]
MDKQHWISGRKTVWEDASKKFRIDEIKAESRTAPPIDWISYERGDSVAALIVNTDTDNVLLVRQFRPPIAEMEGSTEGLTETVAGMIRQNEEPLQTLQREVEEETGYVIPFDPKTSRLKDTEPICTYYSSPGGSSERIYLYYIEVDGNTPKNSGGGKREDGEDIRLAPMHIDKFRAAISRCEFSDAKIIIAGQWLMKRWENRGANGRIKHEFNLMPTNENSKPRIIGYYSTDIGNVKDVDIWVNSSNAECLMDTAYHPSLSARIRTLGGRVSGDVLAEDVIQDALTRRLGIGKILDIGNVIDTQSGYLKRRNNVRRLLHVSSVKARIEPDGTARTVTSIPVLEQCVVNALQKCDQLNKQWYRLAGLVPPYRSILLPLFGGGIDRDPSEFKTKRICETLIPAAVEHFKKQPDSLIERVYFLAYQPLEIENCNSVMSRLDPLSRVRAASSPESMNSGVATSQPQTKVAART